MGNGKDRITTEIDLDSIGTVDSVFESAKEEKVIEDDTVDSVLVDTMEPQSEEQVEDQTSDEEVGVEITPSTETSESSSRQEETSATEGNQEDTADKKKSRRSQDRIRQLANSKRQIEAKYQQAELLASKALERVQQLEKENFEFRNKNLETETTLYQKEVDKAKQALARAYEESDYTAISEAQATLNDAQLNLKLATAKKSNASTTDKSQEAVERIVNEAVAQSSQFVPSNNNVEDDFSDESNEKNAKAISWVKSNAFILGKPEIQDTATGVFESLQAEGYSPTSEEFFEELEDRLGIVHPELVRWFDKRRSKAGPKKEETQTPSKKSQDMAPPSAQASQTVGTGGEKPQGRPQVTVRNGKTYINPTQRDVDMANRLGIPVKDYLVEKLKYEKGLKEGKRTTSIF